VSPLKAPTSCSVPGCPERAAQRGRCFKHAAHTQQQYEQARGTSTERGYGSAWRKVRGAYLLAYPFCVDCYKLGRMQYAEHVDHIVPKSQGGADDESNWQSLCASHHSAKTMREINRMRGK
jgi:5-methylcytosine-specific restriction protein A